MSTELERQPITIVSPETGEVLSLESPTKDLGQLLLDIREHESLLRETKNIVQREILKRMTFNARYTEHVGGLKLTGSSPKPEEVWDGATLRAALMDFVDCGTLSIEAVDAAVEQQISWKCRKRGIDSLRSLGGEIAETIEGLKSVQEKDRRVQVSRA